MKGMNHRFTRICIVILLVVIFMGSSGCSGPVSNLSEAATLEITRYDRNDASLSMTVAVTRAEAIEPSLLYS